MNERLEYVERNEVMEILLDLGYAARFNKKEKLIEVKK